MSDRILRFVVAPHVAFLLLLLSGTPASGQAEGSGLAGAAEELDLKRDTPAASSEVCESRELTFGSFAAPDPESAALAERLASDANQAAILGEPGRAHDLLRRATVLDRSSSTISYRFARLLETEGETDAALDEYCRFIALAPTAERVEDVRARIRQLDGGASTAIPDGAREAMREGIRAMDDGDHAEAIRRFSLALVEHPDWDVAHYNRGLAYLAAGRAAAGSADLEWYLELAPQAADRGAVERRLSMIRGGEVELERTVHSPRTTLLAGLVVPGLGHFYSDRPVLGSLALGAAGAAVGVGMLYREIDIRCRTLSAEGECPAGQVTSRSEDRPLLTPGLITAGAITLLSAVHAYWGARQDRFRVSDGGGLEASLGTVPVGGSASSGAGARLQSILSVEPDVSSGTVGLRTSLGFRF